MSIDKEVSRRDFLKIAGVAGAAVGLGAGMGGIVAACGGTAGAACGATGSAGGGGGAGAAGTAWGTLYCAAFGAAGAELFFSGHASVSRTPLRTRMT